ncbi:PucR family transcriptional regulator [Cetobacterium sp. SF1]|uniref:PucR family transcriptional regulator n=1 Tax=Cetobacterium sp. SF1 TaxID=3417654 RepID=UPI003CEA73F6
MYFKCNDLNKIMEFKEAKLISGETGLAREISWPYIKMTDSIKDWINGKELIFILDESKKKLKYIIEEAIEKNASGIVILSKNNNIEFSEEIIKLSEENKFPIFLLDWNIKLLNLTQKIIYEIQSSKNKYENIKLKFQELLFNNCSLSFILEKLYNIKSKNYYSLVSIRMNKNKKLEEFYSFILKKLKQDFLFINNLEENQYVDIFYDNQISIFLLDNNKEKLKNYIKSFQEIYQKINEHQNESLFFQGKIRDKDFILKESYNEIEKLIEISSLFENKDKIYDYYELGFYRLLFQIKEINILKEFYLENIGILINHDEKFKTKLLQTLKEYYINNRNLTITSEKLNIHKNTLIYRINIIKELLKKDLNLGLENLELFNSIIIYEYLKKVNKN